MLVQHCSHHKLGCTWQMHYLLMEAVKLGSMQGFSHVISDHLICQTIFDANGALGLLISNVEVSDVQMTRALARTLSSIGLEQHSHFVVLKEDILLDWISLFLKKLSYPYHWGDNLVSGYHFCFDRSSCVHPLLCAEGSNGSITH